MSFCPGEPHRLVGSQKALPITAIICYPITIRMPVLEVRIKCFKRVDKEIIF
jgi:hypothetical protein